MVAPVTKSGGSKLATAPATGNFAGKKVSSARWRRCRE
jgi:hypothetical protein